MNHDNNYVNNALNEFYMFKSRQKKKAFFWLIIGLSLIVAVLIMVLGVFAINNNNKKIEVEEEISSLNEEATISDVVAVFGSYYELSNSTKKKIQNYEILEEKIKHFDLNADELGIMWENLKFSKINDGYAIEIKEDESIGILIVPSNYKGTTVTEIKGGGFSHITALEIVVIPDTVQRIGSSAFSKTGIKELTLPEGVDIEDSAFNECTSLTSVTIPDSVTSIGDYAFKYCTGLTSITIPDSVTSIGDSAFMGCTSLTSVTIGSGVTSIGDAGFYKCTGLTEINFNATVMDDLRDTGKIDTGITNAVFSYAGQSGDGITVNIGANVTKIPAYLFNPNNDISSSPKIISVVFSGESICKSIGEEAFYKCTSLTSITIPDSVTSIGDYAFKYCTGLTSITIPDSVTSIGSYAFDECTSLTNVYYGATESKWNGVNIGSFNKALTSATRYYYSAEQTTDTKYNYWHYVDGVPRKW